MWGNKMKKFKYILGQTGAGKTKLALDYAKDNNCQNVLYVTQASLMPQAINENIKWGTLVPNLNTLSYGLCVPEKNSYKSNIEKAKQLTQDVDIDLIILDECHSCLKNYKSKWSKVVIAILEVVNCPVIALTGTSRSVDNRDLFLPIILDKFNPDRDFSVKDIQQELRTMEGEYGTLTMQKMGMRSIPVWRDGNTSKLLTEFEKITEKVRSPAGNNIDVTVHEHEAYCLDDVKALFKKIKREKTLKVKNNKVINYTTHALTSFADGHVQLTDMISEEKTTRFFRTQPKLEVLSRILPNIEGKVIIFTRYVPSVQLILSKLGDTAVALDEGKEEEALEKFKNEDSVKYLVTTISKGSTGFDLDVAKAVVFYAVSHNYLQLEQAFYRHIRYNTTVNKEIHFIYADLEKTKFRKILNQVVENAEKYGFGSVLVEKD